MEPSFTTVKRNIIVAYEVSCGRAIRQIARGNRSRVVPPKHWGILLVLLVFAATIGKGTTIGVVVQPQLITVATDSARRVERRTGAQSVVSECKIHLRNGLLFLMAGIVKDEDVKFFPLDLAQSASNGATDVSVAMAALKASLLERLPSVVANARRRNSIGYRRWISGKVPIITVFFVSATGSTRVAVCEFFLREAEIKPNCPSLGNNFHLMMGTRETATYVKGTNEKEFGNSARRNPIEFVRSIVELEIATSRLINTGDVGPPITVARFDTTGLRFIERGVCTAEQGDKKK